MIKTVEIHIPVPVDEDERLEWRKLILDFSLYSLNGYTVVVHRDYQGDPVQSFIFNSPIEMIGEYYRRRKFSSLPSALPWKEAVKVLDEYKSSMSIEDLNDILYRLVPHIKLCVDYPEDIMDSGYIVEIYISYLNKKTYKCRSLTELLPQLEAASEEGKKLF